MTTLKHEVEDFYRTGMRLLMGSDLHGVRLLLAVAETVWMITLIWPGDSFSRPTYQVMSMVMSEPAWALVFAMTSACQWSILFSGKYHDRLAVIFAAWNSTLWWFVVVCMYTSISPPPAAISGEFSLAVGASWVWMRSGYCFRLEEKNGKVQ
jgi:hypothetical protein